VTAQQPLRGDVAVLVPAAGLGTRLGSGMPKALRELGGTSLLAHTIRRIGGAACVGCVVVAAPVGMAAAVRENLAAELPSTLSLMVVEGGETRQDSVSAALRVVPPDYPIILVHDAARALAPTWLVERVADAVRIGHDAVVPVLPVVDTVKQIDEDGYVVATPDRAGLRLVQTPQGFRRAVLVRAHEAAIDHLTDDAGLVEQIGVRVFCVPGSDAAMKITRPADLAAAELLFRADTLGS
jgi:2-C-methyl-D-erythritol 4-phosphate cytidylyltransferase